MTIHKVVTTVNNYVLKTDLLNSRVSIMGFGLLKVQDGRAFFFVNAPEAFRKTTIDFVAALAIIAGADEVETTDDGISMIDA